MKLLPVVLALLLAAPAAFARKSDAEIRDSVQREEIRALKLEIDALARERMRKADSLERLEAAHWGKRYAESQFSERHQATVRELDGRYGKLSTDLGRLGEELVSARELSADAGEKADGETSAYEAFAGLVKSSVDRSMEEVPGDHPVGMDARLLRLRKAQEEGEKKKPDVRRMAEAYFAERLERHEKTILQTFGSETTQFGNRPDVRVTRLRLGTIFLGETDAEGEVQALLRTGSLQGKVFEWNASLPAPMAQAIRKAVREAAESDRVVVPVDLLQNKAVKRTISDAEETGLKQALEAWFKKGGLVMYPLLLVALLALFLFAERSIVITRRGRSDAKFDAELERLVAAKEYEKAADLCLKRDTGLSLVLFSVLRKARDDRETAEKSLQEGLLREQPKLERHMALLAAMGGIAPLLGLLGTVTGIIDLFTVITEVGTNDARILAGGISEALVTTEAGLIIASPTMVLHGILNERLEKATSEICVRSTELLNRIFPKAK